MATVRQILLLVFFVFKETFEDKHLLVETKDKEDEKVKESGGDYVVNAVRSS